MYNLIVLGQVPGTNMRISFQAWLAVFVGLVLGVVWLRTYIKRLTLVAEKMPRRPVHASQLHRRG